MSLITLEIIARWNERHRRFLNSKIIRCLRPKSTGDLYKNWQTTRCVIITGTPNFQGQNLVNMWFICAKISGAKARNDATWSANRIVLHMYCLYRVTSLSTWRHCDTIVNLLTSVLLIRQSDSGAPVCARVSRRKANTLNTNLASSFRPLLVGHSYLF